MRDADREQSGAALTPGECRWGVPFPLRVRRGLHSRRRPIALAAMNRVSAEGLGPLIQTLDSLHIGRYPMIQVVGIVISQTIGDLNRCLAKEGDGFE